MSHLGNLWRRATGFRLVLLLALLLSVTFVAFPPHRLDAAHQAAKSATAAASSQGRFIAPAHGEPAATVGARATDASGRESSQQPSNGSVTGAKAPSSASVTSSGTASAPSAPSGSGARATSVGPTGGASGQQQVISATAPNASISPPPGATAGKSLMGARIRDYAEIQDKRIPLPPGDWIVTAHFSPAQSESGDVESVFLAQSKGDQLSSAVIVQLASVGASTPGFRKAAQCMRPVLLHTTVYVNEDFGEQDCWTLNHNLWSDVGGRSTPPLVRAALGDLNVRGVRPPGAMLSAFFRLANKSRSLHAIYYFNPEAEGIKSSPTPIWEESDWNRDYLHQYPEKVAYVGRLREWAERWHPRVRDSFLAMEPAAAKGTTNSQTKR